MEELEAELEAVQQLAAAEKAALELRLGDAEQYGEKLNRLLARLGGQAPPLETAATPSVPPHPLQPAAPQGQSQQAKQSEGSWTAALEAGRQSSREASAPLIGRLAWPACSYCRVTAASTLRYSLR